MNRAIDAAARQCRIGRVHNRVHILADDVALDQLDGRLLDLEAHAALLSAHAVDVLRGGLEGESPPKYLLSHWLWWRSHHNQWEKGDLGDAKPPQTPLH